MDADFLLPKLSATMEEAQIVRWLKKVGDPVMLGEPLVELETDKAAMEVEATETGILAEVLVQEGSTAVIGAVLARIAGKEGMTAAPGRPVPPPVAADGPTPRSRPAAASAPPATQARDGFIAASPSARGYARTRGVDLAGLSGTGPRGMITRADIDAAAALNTDGASAGEAPLQITPLAPARRRIAEEVAASRREIPAFWLDRWVDASRAQAALAEGGSTAAGNRPTLTDILLATMAAVLPGHPAMMQVWAGGDPPAFRRHSSVDVGLIVASADRILVPVLKGLQGRALADISNLRRGAVEAARGGRIPAGLAGPCSISLSNLAGRGADRFEAIIQPGQSSILAIGRLHERAVARGGAIAARIGFHATLSVDHRLIDGVAAADFLGAFAEAIEAGS